MTWGIQAPGEITQFFRIYYAERLVSIFTRQVQCEYCGGNISLYIEGIVLEQFSTFKQLVVLSYSGDLSWHAVFHSFSSDEIKQDAGTTSDIQLLFVDLITIW